jgi:hypothetical protein
LVSELLGNGTFDWSEIENLYLYRDQSDNIVTESQLNELQEQIDQLEADSDSEEYKALQEKIAFLHDSESQPQEIFEWWLVSDWFLYQMEELNHPVLHTDYGSWWGRCCAGQAISLDYDIKKLYEKIHHIQLP